MMEAIEIKGAKSDVDIENKFQPLQQISSMEVMMNNDRVYHLLKMFHQNLHVLMIEGILDQLPLSQLNIRDIQGKNIGKRNILRSARVVYKDANFWKSFKQTWKRTV